MTHDAATTIDWHPEDPATLANPYPLFSRMRDEDPCHWSPRLRSWVLTRYDDVRRACLDRERYSSDRLRPFFAAMPADEASRIADIVRYLSLWMVFKDPPEHTRLRRLAGKVFTARSMQAMRPQIGQTTEWLLQRIGDRESFDFIADFAGPLPCLVIMAMLGVPREDFRAIKAWSDDLRLFIGTAQAEGDKYRRARDGADRMSAYFREIIAQRRNQPGPDAISRMVAARDEGGMLSEDELVGCCMLFLFGGHETTTNLLGSAIVALLKHPDQLERLHAQPALIDSAVEEFLRYDGPSNSIARVVAQDHEIAGKTLRAGERVFAMINAANRDPRQFTDPHRLDLGRTPNRHLTFGFGIHFCLGAPLARMEAKVCLGQLAARFPGMHSGSQPPEWIDALIMRGPKRLPLVLA